MLAGGCNESFPSFDSQKHQMLTAELKELYVVVTRAKQRLLIYDTNLEAAKPVSQVFLRQKLVREEPLDTGILDSFAVSSTKEEWLRRGADLFRRELYRQAQAAFSRGQDEDMARLSNAKDTVQDAHRAAAVSQTAEVEKKWISAAVVYESLCERLTALNRSDQAELNLNSLRNHAAVCFTSGRNLERAAHNYAAVEQWCDVARCFEQLNLWRKAAEAHSRRGASALDDVVRCCSAGMLFVEAIEMIEAIKQADSSSIDRAECDRKQLEVAAQGAKSNEKKNKADLMLKC
eukprot:2915604-Prymnesium_polylepis.1